MDPGQDSKFTEDPVDPLDVGSNEEATMPVVVPPPPPPPPTPQLPPVDGIMKAVHHNARHRMAPKKHVVIQRCDICNIELTGQVVIDAHLKGSKHAKKVKAKQLQANSVDVSHAPVENLQNDKSAVFKCDICNVTLNSSQQLEGHYDGAKHKAKLSESGNQHQPANNQDLKTMEPSTGGSTEAGGPMAVIANPLELSCAVCGINVNSAQQLEQHLNSKKHQERESGRSSHRPSPYSRGGRGGRGGLGSHSRGGRPTTGKYSTLSSSFKSAGYSNSFIKPEGGVIMPSNCGTNKGSNQPPPSHPYGGKSSNFGGQFKNRGNFGSLTPYVSADNGRGGYYPRGGASRGGWTNSNPPPMPPQHPASYGGYDYEPYGYGYGYAGYENSDGFGGYGMMQSGPPPNH